MLKVLITGASGFLGSNLIKTLTKYSNFKITGSVRNNLKSQNMSIFDGFELKKNTDWSIPLKNQTIVIHTAGFNQFISPNNNEQLKTIHSVNVDGTLELARQAARAGVKRFIFISSIKVLGEETFPEKPFTAETTPSPGDVYGMSKYEAEQGLKKISVYTDMEIVIIRPPLIYGKGVKGNFAQIISLIQKKFILPFGSINNKRSFVGIDNLIDFIIICMTHQKASNQIFLVSDGQDISTTELIKILSRTMRTKVRLISISSKFLELFSLLIGKKKTAVKLLHSLQVDISKNYNVIGWKPPFTFAESIKRCFESNDIEKIGK